MYQYFCQYVPYNVGYIQQILRSFHKPWFGPKFGSRQENVTRRHQSLATGLQEGKHVYQQIFLQRSHSNSNEEELICHFGDLVIISSYRSSNRVLLLVCCGKTNKQMSKQTKFLLSFHMFWCVPQTTMILQTPVQSLTFLNRTGHGQSAEYMRLDAAAGQRAVMHNIDLVFCLTCPRQLRSA